MIDRKFRVMLARFPYGGQERTELIDWTAQVAAWATTHPQIEKFILWHVDDTPVTMCRNRAVKEAIDGGVDILIMVDSDMVPDIDPTHPFLPSAFRFLLSRWDSAPTMIAAPYCMQTGNPAFGRWRSGKDGYEVKADLFTREEAAAAKGIGPAPLLATGLIMMDMRIFTGFTVGWQDIRLPPPWFDYEWTDEYRTHKGSTEDIFFSRNVSILFAQHGIETNFVDWDSWAWHIKTKPIGKPVDLSVSELIKLMGGK